VSGELLFELLSEEIPARMQRRAIEDLTALVRDKLAAAEIQAATLSGYVTPRRLTVIAEGIPEHQPDRGEERRGPRLGAPPAAIDGFLRAAGLLSIDQCEIRDTGRGEFYFAKIERPGGAASEVLPELLRVAIGELPWPKSMRYPASSLRWVRPLTSAICLFDGAVLPLALHQVPVGRSTRGHRFLSQGDIAVDNAADYLEKLEAAYVILDHDRRRDIIAADLDRLAAEAGVTVKPDPALLDEVAGLVEFPVALMGAIDDESMALPPEVLATAMRTHQKYFSCLNPEPAPAKAGGSLAPRFLFVANNLTPDDGKTIIAGNERVLRARLADARFFWDQDRRIPLENRLEALKKRVFNDKLGEHVIKGLDPNRPEEDFGNWASMRMKVWRIASLAVFLAERQSNGSGGYVPDADPQLAARAAELAKADLSTGMVGEFPELQGIMGRYYALHPQDPRYREDPRVADAIADHYKPLGPNDTCPTAPESVIVALADKIDTLVAFFALGERPTGSRDPFALRRAALGVIRLLLENGLRLPLSIAFREGYSRVDANQAAAALLGYHTPGKPLGPPLVDPTADLLEFIADRLKVHLREQGVRHDLIAAVFALAEDDLVRLLARVDALQKFLQTTDGANLLVAYRRASNIVAIEEKRDDSRYDGDVLLSRLQEPEEQTLAERLAQVAAQVGTELSREFFESAMIALSQLREPVDAFFDKVTVNTDEAALRENRLRLLSRIRAVMNQVADFSQIEG
jgi:glycyl-tRNA synthetase beta chain